MGRPGDPATPTPICAAATYAGSNAASMTNYYTQSRDWQMKFMCTARKSFCLCKNILKVVVCQKNNNEIICSKRRRFVYYFDIWKQVQFFIYLHTRL